MISKAAFENTMLERFVSPNALQTICPGAFFHCSKLKTVILNEGVQSIGAAEQGDDHGAFEDCALESILLPSTL